MSDCSISSNSSNGGEECGAECPPEGRKGAPGFELRSQNCGLCGDCCPCKKVCIIRPEAKPLDFLMAAEIKIVTDPKEAKGADVLVIVGPDIPDELVEKIRRIRCTDAGFDKELNLFLSDEVCMPVIYSPLVPVTEYHDVRVYHDAAAIAFDRVVFSKFKNPLLYVPRCTMFPNGDLITALGALHSIYVPLHVREECPNSTQVIKNLWLWAEDTCKGEKLCRELSILEPGRFVYRDVAMTGPERMTPIQIEDYVYELFKEGPIVMEVICDPDTLRDEFPLFDAVNRASFRAVKRHAGRIVLLEYVPPCFPRKTLLIVSKGAAYDTGGVNIKIDGLAGVSRDKAGSAAAIGFMEIVGKLKPIDIHVISALCLVRNNIGEQAYVPDEIVKSRAGLRVRFNNTDAEGRLAMSDALTFMREQVIAYNLPDPHIFTIGTMTHHARIAVGDGYAIILDNSVAKAEGNAYDMQWIGMNFGEPFEISMLRKDDFEMNRGRAQMEDLIQTNCCYHQLTMRQHQIPMAFLMTSTGLDEHDFSSCLPIKYTHIDMQGNAFNYPYIPASQPVITLAKAHLD